MLASTASGAVESVRTKPVAEDACAFPRVPVVVKGAPAVPAAACARGSVSLREPARAAPLRSAAYTPRFLPGFAVTIDRAHAVWSGFLAGVGQSLAGGRNCFTTACGGPAGVHTDGFGGPQQTPIFGSGTGLDMGPTVDAPGDGAPVAEAMPAYAARVLPAGTPDVGGVALAYGWSFAPTGVAPLDVRVSVAQNAYRWGVEGSQSAAFATAGAPVDTARGRSVSLEVRAARLSFEAAEHRLRLDAVPAFGVAYDDAPVRRRDLRVTLDATGVQFSAAMSETTSDARGGAKPDRAAWLGFRVPLH